MVYDICNWFTFIKRKMLKLHKINVVCIYIYIYYIILYFKYITILVIDLNLQKEKCWNYIEIKMADLKFVNLLYYTFEERIVIYIYEYLL